MATPNYSDLATMAETNLFLQRCTMAVIKYAEFILGNNASTLAKQNWAKGAIQNPSGAVSPLRYAIAMDGAFTSQDPLNFPGTSDATLQGIVESTINSVLQF